MSNPVPILILEPLSGMSFNRQGWGARTHTHTYTCWVCRQQLFDFAQLLHRISHRESGNHTYTKQRRFLQHIFSELSNCERKSEREKVLQQIVLPAEERGMEQQRLGFEKGNFSTTSFHQRVTKMTLKLDYIKSDCRVYIQAKEQMESTGDRLARSHRAVNMFTFWSTTSQESSMFIDMRPRPSSKAQVWPEALTMTSFY